MPAPRGIVQWVDQELHKSGLLPRAGRLLVAVSGGADSVALLRLLVEINRSDYWNWELLVGHVDHGMRGKESTEDAAWVKALAGGLKLRFIKRMLKLGAEASEAEARGARLEALGGMSAAHGCAGVVMAHHLDDQAETVLMRIFRGCGLEGLEGMRATSEGFGSWKEKGGVGGGKEGTLLPLKIFRPLLNVRREALRAYLRTLDQTWREDASNVSRRYARNQVRAEVMPVVEKIWPGAVEAVGRLARIAGEVQGVLREHEEPIWQGAVFRQGGGIELPRVWLRTAYPAVVKQVLRDAIEVMGGTREIADHERIGEAARLIRGKSGGKTIQMGRGVVVELEGHLVRVVLREVSERVIGGVVGKVVGGVVQEKRVGRKGKR